MRHLARITEIFSSLQGEGPYTGVPTTFVRFSKCRIGCEWCDTSYALCDSRVCNVTQKNAVEPITVDNPITVTKLNELIYPFNDKMLSITGGEPLEQAAFLEEWLPSLQNKGLVLLETNGVMHSELKRIVDFIHIVGMDFKLPSSAGCRPFWEEHEIFLNTALSSGREVYIKIVVTEKTTDKDIQEAIGVIYRINKFVPVIVQPAAQTLTFHDIISQGRLNSINRVCSAYLPNVQLATQMHKEWGIQ